MIREVCFQARWCIAGPRAFWTYMVELAPREANSRGEGEVPRRTGSISTAGTAHTWSRAKDSKRDSASSQRLWTNCWSLSACWWTQRARGGRHGA